MLNQDRQQARVTMIPCFGIEIWIEDNKHTRKNRTFMYWCKDI